jgi:hypothetical protein
MNYYSPAAQERARDAAYEAVENFLSSMHEPISRHALNLRWNKACEAMAKYLEAQDTGEE